MKQGECEMRKAECGVAAVMVVAEAWGGGAEAEGGTAGEERRGELKSAQLDCHVNSCADR